MLRENFHLAVLWGIRRAMCGWRGRGGRLMHCFAEHAARIWMHNPALADHISEVRMARARLNLFDHLLDMIDEIHNLAEQKRSLIRICVGLRHNVKCDAKIFHGIINKRIATAHCRIDADISMLQELGVDSGYVRHLTNSMISHPNEMRPEWDNLREKLCQLSQTWDLSLSATLTATAHYNGPKPENR